MKAVVYHADASVANQYSRNIYELLFRGLKTNLNSYGIPLIHLTLDGYPGWGDKNYFFKGNPEDIVYNREKFFLEFLKGADPNETYWFTEPDSRLLTIFPDLKTDAALLYRNREPHITPAWRLAKKSSLTFFEEVFSYYNLEKKDWDVDSIVYQQLWKLLGSPLVGEIEYNKTSIELREYKQYCTKKSYYTRQYKFKHKLELVELEKNDPEHFNKSKN
jgi:hypothetical protein